MRPAVVVIIVYLQKSRVMVWRAARSLKPCDRLSSPLPVIFQQLIIIANETSHRCRYSLPNEIESDIMKSCKVSKTL